MTVLGRPEFAKLSSAEVRALQISARAWLTTASFVRPEDDALRVVAAWSAFSTQTASL
jgi:hypothetical protein